MNLLEVKELRSGYGKSIVLDGISLRLQVGGLITIIGPNGAGKSTLLRSIVNLVNIHSGSISFQNKDITKLSHKYTRKFGISLVPQTENIFPKMTVQDNLLIAANGLAKHDLSQRTEEEFDRFPVLRNKRKQLGGTLSGGERQMLAISCGLISRPIMLLLDEPSMGLAPMLVSKLMETIKDIQKEGTSIILVEQKPQEALEIADYAYLLEGGKIKMEGHPDNFFSDKKFVKKYLGM